MPETINSRLISWASDIEAETLRQAEKAARLPIVEGHVALMPDAHVGLGATVGSVIPTRGAVIPSAVGVDIGCGMIAAELDLHDHQLPDSLDPLLGRIAGTIPAGVGRGHARAARRAERWLDANRPATELSFKQVTTAATQFGTLGSGNHFFELCLDERGRVWVVLHSGSRGIGNQLAQMHIAGARRLARALSLRLEDPDLAYLSEGTPEFEAYIADMLWAQDYARANRDLMMDRALAEVVSFVGAGRETRRVNCFGGETEVITRAGVRPIGELAGGVHELLTAGGLWVKAPVRSFGPQRLMRITLMRSKVIKVIHATAEHGWFLVERNGMISEAQTKELRPRDRLATCFPAVPTDRAVDRDAVARGFVFGDGAATKYRAVANFCGEKDLALLPYFEGCLSPRSYGTMKRINGLPRWWKTDLPSLNAPHPELYGWLAGYFAADGDVDKTGRPTLSSSSRAALEFVRVACAEVGVGTFGIRTRMRVGYGKVATPVYLVGLMRGDLDEDFFIVPRHRERFLAGRTAAERRGWNVVSVEPTDRVEEVFCAVVDGTHAFALADNILTRNCHHNFTQRETHRGAELWITRKGAIKAGRDDLGVIPGSMGTRSYIVRGRGNPDSWESCSHGAGRRHSRTRARKLFTTDDLAEQMAGKVWLADRAEALLDEIPGAYKDIDQVMADQTDLVEVLHTLHQILNYKGV